MSLWTDVDYKLNKLFDYSLYSIRRNQFEHEPNSIEKAH